MVHLCRKNASLARALFPRVSPFPVRYSLAPRPFPCATPSIRDRARAPLPRSEALPVRRHKNREGLIHLTLEQLQNGTGDERWTEIRRSTVRLRFCVFLQVALGLRVAVGFLSLYAGRLGL